MGLQQYKVGKSWEERVLDYYSSYDYATFKLSTDIAGTVFDIIAIKNNKCVCIECKHCKNKKLYFKSSGLEGKRDELNTFCSKGNEVIICVLSDVDGSYMMTWRDAFKIFNEKGYITAEDGVRVKI